MVPVAAPFVLLEDARLDGGARLYANATGSIEARSLDEVIPALTRLRAALAEGWHAAGYMSYEASFALEPSLARLAGPAGEAAPPFLWFGLFERVEMLDAEAVTELIPDPTSAWTSAAIPRIGERVYATAFASVAAYIAAGDIYQANLSLRADVAVAGHPLALYARIRAASDASWGGVLFSGEHWLLSASPELFFSLEAGKIVARPMKGTARRGADPAADAAAASLLASDQKERAENLMIVDLLRNDIARVGVAGSVVVPALFTVETYPTFHALTSTVTAQLQPQLDAIDMIGALFPCGSITGAPKIRAMEVIAEVESEARSAYTGSLGWLSPDGDAAFNVLIRTLTLTDDVARRGHGQATLGLGSAVVADSDAAAEWRECLLKGAFVTRESTDFDLIETLRAAPDSGAPDLARHLERLRRSAEILGFRFGPDVESTVRAAIAELEAPSRLRLRLTRHGATTIEADAIPEAPDGPVRVAVAPLPVDPTDLRLRFKTSDRAFYDDARSASGAFEVLFIDPGGYVTEGSFTSVFVERDGRLLTPPQSRGLLPGILRQKLIDEGRAHEADLTPGDLASGFFIGNALRGLIRAVIAR